MGTSYELYALFRRDARKLFCKRDRVIAAVSGGPDSMALLHSLVNFAAEFELSLAVAHFDHGLRGSESDEDSLFVKGAAEKLGLPFFLGRGDVIKLQKENGLSLEEASRDSRYSYLKKVAREWGANKVALGHTSDDQAEEVLIRLIRGAGPRGLSGIPAVRDGLFVRPFLRVSRKQIMACLSANNISYRTDISNDSFRFLRNRIRHRLLPLLEDEFNPRMKDVLVQTASILRDDDDFLRGMADDVWPDLSRSESREGSDLLSVDLNLFSGIPHPVQMRILMKGLVLSGSNIKQIGFRHLEAVYSICTSGGPYKALSLPGEITVEKIYDNLIFRKTEPQCRPFSYDIDSPGSYALPEIGKSIVLEVTPVTGETEVQNCSIDRFDYEQIRFPVTVRNFRPGDRFHPSGLGCNQKIKDYFINRKIPRPERKKIPLLVQNNTVIGILGWNVDEYVRISGTTKRILQVFVQ